MRARIMCYNLPEIAARFKAESDKALSETVSGEVVYNTYYAIYVHENLEAYHRVGQAKFLEEPAKLYRYEIARIIAEQKRNGRSWAQAVQLGMLYLLNLSRPLVPVDTGALRESGKIRITRPGEGVARDATET